MKEPIKKIVQAMANEKLGRDLTDIELSACEKFLESGEQEQLEKVILVLLGEKPKI